MDTTDPIASHAESRSIARKLAFAYIAISAVWILFSDLALREVINDVKLLATLEIVKGWVFVAATGAILYFWIARMLQSRQHVESALRDAEGRYRGIFENIQQGIIQTTPEGKVITVNSVFATLLGYPSREDFLRQVSDVATQVYVHPAQRSSVITALERDGTVWGQEIEARRRDGSTLWVSLSAHMVRDAQAKPLYFLTTVQDITERRRVELDLAESQTNLGLALAASEAGTWLWEPITDREVWDEQYKDLYGFPHDAFPSFRLWISRVHEYDRQRILARVQAVLQPGSGELWDEEFRTMHPVKGLRWIQELGRIERDRHGRAVRFRGISFDITQRKQTEEALRRSEELLQLQIQRMPIACIVWDVDFRVRSWNPAATAIFGFTAAEALGKHPYDFLVPEELQPHINSIWKRLLKGDETAASVNENTRKDGQLITASWTNTPLRSPDGKIIGVLSMTQDITQQRRGEEELRASEEKYRLIVETAEEGIWVIDGHEITTFVNTKVASMLGYTVAEIVGRSLLDFMDEEGKRITTVNLTRRRAGVREEHDFLLRTKGGDNLWVMASVSPILDASGAYTGALAMLTDITERKKTEQRLQEMAENLRALAGRLQSIREEERTRISREIHDELGQSLTGLKMDLKWFERRLPPADEVLQEKIHSMFALIDATIGTVRKISTELRPGVLELGLGPALEWGCRDFETRSGMQCTFTRTGKEVPLEDLQSTSLFRIYQELLTNIIRHAEAKKVNVFLRYANNSVTLEVIDDGKGISNTDLVRASSLGLLGIRERAMLIGGNVSFESTPGQGTIVKAMVPVHPQTAH